MTLIYPPEYPRDKFFAYPQEYTNTNEMFIQATGRCAYGLKLGDVWIGDTQDHCGVRIEPADHFASPERELNNACAQSGIYPELWLCEDHQLHKHDLMALNMLICLHRTGLNSLHAEGLYGIDMTGTTDEEMANAFRVFFDAPRIPIDAPSPDEIEAYATGIDMQIWLTEAMARMIRLGLLERVITQDNKFRARPTPYGRICTNLSKDELCLLRSGK